MTPKLVVEASGDGIVCIFLELAPLLKGLRVDRVRFSGDGGLSATFLSSFRLPMTVPRRRRPPKPAGLLFSFALTG